jgi:guanine nucleotide-binding protein subunit alpha
MRATEPDPFAIFHAPPPNETPGERTARIEKEAEEKRISDQIDEQLKVDRLTLNKQKYVVRVLLLGQSESGKGSFYLLIGVYKVFI